jgi:hypothetical protein
MKRFYSLLTSSGTSDQTDNYTSVLGASARIIPYILGLFALCISIITGCIFEWLGIVFLFVAMILSIAGNNKPAIFHTMPVNYKKRTLYYFVDILITVLIALLVVVAVIAVISVISTAVAAINGTLTVEDTTDTEEAEAITFTAAAIAFSLFRTLFVCGGVTGIARIKNNLYFLLGMIGFILLYTVGGLILAICAAGNNEFNALFWLYENYENLPLPWLATTLCALFAVAAWVGSVVYVLKIEKPKSF